MISTDTTYRTSVTVQAPIERAFTVFTDGFDSWWPRGHHIGTAEMAQAVIEPRLGGGGTSAVSTVPSASGDGSWRGIRPTTWPCRGT